MNRRERRRLKKVGRRDDLSSGGATFDIRAAMQQALPLLQAGRSREALRRYRQVLKIYPDHADALNLSGIATFQLGNVERALELIRKALAVQPDHVDAHNNLGNLLKASNRLDEAEAAYRRAIEVIADLRLDGWGEPARSRARPGRRNRTRRRGRSQRRLGSSSR